MYRADAEAPVQRIAFRAARPLTVYRADDKALVRQAADDTVILQKYPVMLRAVAASRK